jgi:uncharacterized membrane protein
VNNWKVIPTIVIATVLIFGAGVFTGGFLVNYVKQTHPKPAKRLSTAAVAPVLATNTVPAVASTNPSAVKYPKPPEVLSKDFLQRLDSELRLTTKQRETIQKIISEGQNQMLKAMQDARLEIRAVLAPEQLKQFDELMKRSFKKSIFGTNGVGVIVPKTPAGINVP